MAVASAEEDLFDEESARWSSTIVNGLLRS